MPSTYYVAWWNLENLFDEENSPRRTEKLQRAIGADLAGWTPARRDRKVSQLASVIAQMNGGAGPDAEDEGSPFEGCLRAAQDVAWSSRQGWASERSTKPSPHRFLVRRAGRAGDVEHGRPTAI